jgi:hypothetical protein
MMREREFDQWLIHGYRTKDGAPMAATTCRARLSNCKTLERHEGDLDAHFASDRFQGLLGRLSYSKDDERAGAAATHRVPIAGNVYDGTATLRSALTLYAQFCASSTAGGPPRPPNASERRPVKPRRPSRPWPEWGAPPESALLQLARLTVPHVRFLHPEIVHAVVEDNERRRAGWTEALSARGIDPTAYLWERCACAFPGVRRYAGGKEIDRFRNPAMRKTTKFPQALNVDHNGYPKQLWSFVSRGKEFQNFGPRGYELAHLLDHKDAGNRSQLEVETVGPAAERASLFGLFTSAANGVFAPTTMIKPTDFCRPLRNLLQRRAASLYGSFCNLLPPGQGIRDAASDAWSFDDFDWSDPVGSLNHVDAFLLFRNETIDDLFTAYDRIGKVEGLIPNAADQTSGPLENMP